MQEQNSKEQIGYVVKLGKGSLKLSGKLLLKIIKAIRENEKQQPKKVSVKKLARDGSSLESVKVDNSNIANFKQSARKFGVDFAIKKDIETGENFLFFKGKDKDCIEHAFKDFYQKDKKYRNSSIFKGKEKAKSSILKQINNLKKDIKEKYQSAPMKEKKHNKGEMAI